MVNWLTSLGLPLEQIAKLLKSGLPTGTLCDILSFALPLRIEFKQELLEERDPELRMRRLLDYLETTEPPQPKESAVNKFPPDFSNN